MNDGADNKITHSIPLGALVEITEGPNAGVRLWVVEQPAYGLPPALYDLGVVADRNLMGRSRTLCANENELRVISVPDADLNDAIHAGDMEGC